MKRLLFVCLSLSLLLGGCTKAPQSYETEILDLFDTVTRVVGYTDSQEEFTAYAEEIKTLLTQYHQAYDIYNSYDGQNNLKTINDNAGIAPVKVEPIILELLTFGKEQYIKTEGKVNIALGPVLAVWHDYRTRGIENPATAALPPKEVLEVAAQLCDIDDVVIDKEQGTVFLAKKGMRLDVGAIGKGYATQMIVNSMVEKGFTSGILSVGGNVKAIGTKPEGKPWKMAVQDPKDLNAHLAVFALGDTSLVTSGDYQRYYTVSGQKYHHIIDPETLYPATYVQAVTVLTKDSGIADALSTALFNSSIEEGEALLENQGEAYAVWVDLEGNTIYSKGCEVFLSK